MKVFNVENLANLEADNSKRVAALGFFDGVHKAHQKIIKNVVEKAQKENKKAIVITLDRSPKEYFGKTTVECLTPLTKKSELFSNLGIEEVYYLTFNEDLQNLSAEKFIDAILLKLNVSEVFCGYDYKFGYKGLGTPQLIEQYSKGKIGVNVLDKETIDNVKISTTSLKEFVENGDFVNYYNFAGRHYSILGEVVPGRQLGRTINFPTANLSMQDKYLLPTENGVYITKTLVRGEIYKSITNIGFNPTVSDNKDKKFIETHILDFDMDIYGDTIEVFFYEFLRKEQKFESFNHLKEQLKRDKEACQKKDI